MSTVAEAVKEYRASVRKVIRLKKQAENARKFAANAEAAARAALEENQKLEAAILDAAGRPKYPNIFFSIR